MKAQQVEAELAQNFEAVLEQAVDVNFEHIVVDMLTEIDTIAVEQVLQHTAFVYLEPDTCFVVEPFVNLQVDLIDFVWGSSANLAYSISGY